MTEEEKKDILFQIDMQLYNEFNDTIATMNDHLGDIYSLKDIEEVKQAEKEKEIELLREAVRKQQKEIEELKRDYEIITDDMKNHNVVYTDMPEFEERYISKDKIREIVRWIIVIEDPRSNNYRPIKNTSAQDVYEAFYKIKELVKE